MPRYELKTLLIPIIIVAAVAAVIGLAIYFSSGPSDQAGSGAVKPSYDNALADPVSDKDHVAGAASPRVTIVVYSDFQCPACASFELNVADKLIAAHPDDLRLVFRHFPLSQHPLSQKAAETTEAAGAQGKFWEMAKLIFENQDSLSDDKLIELAGSLGLDTNRLKQELDSGTYHQKVLDDKDSGTRSGVDATPTLYINGEKYDGSRSFDTLNAEISKHLP